MNIWMYCTDILFPLVTATILGGLVGLEREMSGQWAGFRTHILVALGAATFVLVGVSISGEQSEGLSRVIQGVAAGIGFLGAGSILKLTSAEKIKGLTTAGSIWVAAAVGVAAGTKMYALATTGTIFLLFVLKALSLVEKRFVSQKTRRDS